jgi:hypothetical protein
MRSQELNIVTVSNEDDSYRMFLDGNISPHTLPLILTKLNELATKAVRQLEIDFHTAEFFGSQLAYDLIRWCVSTESNAELILSNVEKDSEFHTELEHAGVHLPGKKITIHFADSLSSR